MRHSPPVRGTHPLLGRHLKPSTLVTAHRWAGEPSDQCRNTSGRPSACVGAQGLRGIDHHRCRPPLPAVWSEHGRSQVPHTSGRHHAIPRAADAAIPTAHEEAARLPQTRRALQPPVRAGRQDATLPPWPRCCPTGSARRWPSWTGSCSHSPPPACRAGRSDRQLREHAGGAAVDRVLLAVSHHRRALTVPGCAARSGRWPSRRVGRPGGRRLPGHPQQPRHRAQRGHAAAGHEHAAMVCGMLLARGLVIRGGRGRARQELVERLLLSRRPGRRRGGSLGAAPGPGHRPRTLCVQHQLGPAARRGPGGHRVVLARLAPERGDQPDRRGGGHPAGRQAPARTRSRPARWPEPSPRP